MFCGLEGALLRGKLVPWSQRLRCTQTTSRSPGRDTSLGDRLLFGHFHTGLWFTESSCRCSQVSVAHLKIKIICVWRAPQPLRCLSSQLRRERGCYCLSLAAGQAWQKCKVLGSPPELCFLSWLTTRVCCLALGGMRLSPGYSSAKLSIFFFFC